MLEMLLGSGRKFVNPGSWVQLSDAGGPSLRAGACAAGIDDKVYTFGGYYNNPSTILYGDLRCYDTVSGTWSTKKTGPPIRYGAIALVARGKLYVHAGRGASAYLKDLWEYDPTLDTWASKTAGIINRGAGAGCVINDVLYVGTGYTTTYANDLCSYNIDTNSWTPLNSCPGDGRHNAAMAAVGTKLYLYGGTSAVKYSEFWCYDTLTGNWEQLPDGPPARTSHSMVAIGGKLYVHGGLTTVGGWKGETWRYDPVTGVWDAMKALAPGHAVHYAAVCQDKLIIGAGQVDGGTAGVVRDCWQYTPPL